MTARLEEALRRARNLPPEEQDRIAALILEEIESEARWEQLFSRSEAKLEQMAEDARQEAARRDALDRDPADRWHE